MKKLGASLVIVVLMFCLLAGVRTGTQQTEQEKDTAYQSFSEKKDNGKPNIYLITKGYVSNYWIGLREGAAAAAEDLDCNLYMGGTPSEENPELLGDLMQDALEKGADAIIVSPTNVPAVVEAAEQIKKARVPLVFVDTILNEHVFDVCYETDNVQAGRLAAREMLSLLHRQKRSESEHLSIGIGIGLMESQTILERLAGFQEYWSANAPEAWEVLEDIKCNQGDMDAAQTQAYEFMEENSDLAGLVALNNGSSIGTAHAIKNAKRTDLALVGFDFSDEMHELIRNQDYEASSIVQKQYDMGYQSVEAARMLLSGQASPYKFVDTGVQQINAGNIDSPYIQNVVAH